MLVIYHRARNKILVNFIQDSVQGSDEFADSLVHGVHSMLGNTVGRWSDPQLRYMLFH